MKKAVEFVYIPSPYQGKFTNYSNISQLISQSVANHVSSRCILLDKIVVVKVYIGGDEHADKRIVKEICPNYQSETRPYWTAMMNHEERIMLVAHSESRCVLSGEIICFHCEKKKKRLEKIKFFSHSRD